MSLKRVFVCGFSCMAAALAFCANPVTTTYTWRAANGNYTGSFDDPAHWNKDAVPGRLCTAKFTASADYTLNLPLGTYDSYASFDFTVGNGNVNTISGKGGTFRMPATDDDNYLPESFILRAPHGHFFNLESYQLSEPRRYRFAHAELTDILLTATNTAGSVDLHFNEGTFRFYGVDGDNALPRLTVDHYGSSTFNMFVHGGSTFIAPTIEFRGNADAALISFDGGTHYVNGTLRMPSDNFADKQAVSTFEVKDGADVKLSSAQIGQRMGTKKDGVSVWVYSTNRTFNIVARDGGTMSFTNDFNHSYGGRLNFDVLDGATFYATNNVVKLGGDVNCPNHFRVVDANLVVDALRTGAYTPGTFAVTNATMTLRADWYLYNTAFTLCDSRADMSNILIGVKPTNGGGCSTAHVVRTTLNLHGGANLVGDAGDGVLHLHDGAKVNVKKTFNIAKLAGSTGLLAMEEGSSFHLKMAEDSEAAFNVGKEGDGTFVMNGGTFRLTDADNTSYDYQSLYMGNTLGSHGEIEMRGGEMIIEPRGGLVIGSMGDAKFLMKGGYLEAEQIRMSYGFANGSATSVLHQTGGEIYIRTTEVLRGVNAADQPGYSSSVILDGGLLRASRVRGWTGASVKGGGGWASLRANGGTIRAVCNTTGFVETFDEAKLGEKGLVLDSDAYAVTIPQDFADDENAQGVLLLKGEGTKTLTGTNATQSYLVLAQGKTVFGMKGGIPASHDAHVIVTNGAMLSFAGNHTGTAFKSLTLGDDQTFGFLEMDADDSLEIETSFVLNKVLFKLNDSFEAGHVYTLASCGGDVPDETLSRWCSMALLDGALAGRKVRFHTSFDASSVKTLFMLEVQEDAAPAQDLVWKGPGNVLNEHANWGGAFSSGTPCHMVFSDADAPQNPAFGTDMMFGALSFTAARDFTLSGPGALNFPASVFSKVSVERGHQTIACAVNTASDLECAVAKDASLTLSGPVKYGSIKKTGGGTLDLVSPDNVFFGTVVLDEGQLRVPFLSSLGGTTDCAFYAFVQNGGTIVFGEEGSDCGVWPHRMVVSAPSAKNAVVWKSAGDVTLAAPEVVSGAPIKRGPGRMTLLSDGNATISMDSFGSLSNDQSTSKNSTYTFDEINGTPPAPEDPYPGFMVTEGELVLRGTKPDGAAVFNMKAHLQIGMNTMDGKVQPGMVIDNARVNARSASHHFMLGCAINTNYTFASEPYLYVTNNAYLEVDTLMIGRYSSGGGITNRVLVDHATIYNSYTLHAMRFIHPDSRGILIFRNNACCLTPWMQFEGIADLTFDASTLAKESATSPGLTYIRAGSGNSSTGTVRFKNRSKAYLSRLELENNHDPAFKLSFEGESEWIPSLSGNYKALWKRTDRCAIETVDENGLVLTPGNACEWTMAKAITGAGGVLKKGEGTLRFVTQEIIDSSTGVTNKLDDPSVSVALRSPFTLDFDKPLDIREGRVVVEEGAARTNAVFTGTGTLSAVALPSPTLKIGVGDDYLSQDVLTLEDFTARGTVRIDAGRTQANPLARPFRPFVVARYTGAAPDTSNWKLVNTGLSQGYTTAFVAQDGLVTASVRVGLIITFK